MPQNDFDAVYADDRPPDEQLHLDRTQLWSGPIDPASTQVRPKPTTGKRGRRRGRGEARGIARRVNLRSAQRGRAPQSGQMQILNLRLERFSQTGERRPPVAVELRGRDVSGQIGEGDEVRAVGRWRSGTLQADYLTNISTRAMVRASSGWPPWVTLRLVLAVVAGLVLAGMFAVPSLRAEIFGDDGPPPSRPGPIQPGGYTGGPQGTGGNQSDWNLSEEPNQPDLVAVPPVRGNSEIDARQELLRAGFFTEVQNEENDAAAPGTVLRTDPPGNTLQKPGTTVKIFVAKAPLGSTTKEPNPTTSKQVDPTPSSTTTSPDTSTPIIPMPFTTTTTPPQEG